MHSSAAGLLLTTFRGYNMLNDICLRIDPDELPAGHSGGLVHEGAGYSISFTSGNTFNDRRSVITVRCEELHLSIVGGKSMMDFVQQTPDRNQWCEQALRYAFRAVIEDDGKNEYGDVFTILSQVGDTIHRKARSIGNYQAQSLMRKALGIE